MAAWTERPGMGARRAILASIDRPETNGGYPTTTWNDRAMDKVPLQLCWLRVAQIGHRFRNADVRSVVFLRFRGHLDMG